MRWSLAALRPHGKKPLRPLAVSINSVMRLPADYHTHTPLCRHATGEPVELAAQAVLLGLPELGFSDHNPMPRDDFDDWRMKASQLDLYIEKVEQARRAFPALPIKIGLEVDYLPGTRGLDSRTSESISLGLLDRLGSLHLCGMGDR